ncbi:RagB/SusD family nutrient uptake outer membrane protein [Maribellus sediminis]|uniref:RagB/SusD family nutrient uptake outer membrane protein n=1 Tax=Maribellus sediminis TaxID=2696285 RepID=UPI001430EB67|nr:RagB/SusD family nutrient uptake outer membrane protein [Maribellus sediminis]
MKKYILKNNFLIVFTVLLLSNFSCTNFLEEEVYTEYDPDSFLATQEGIDALLTGVYSGSTVTGFEARNYYYILSEFVTDISFETDGGLATQLKPVQEFNWNSGLPYIDGLWNQMYQAISRANNVINVTKTLSSTDQDVIDKIVAECRFIRGYSYFYLHGFFGPTPIIEIPADASLDEIEAIGKTSPRATEAEYRAYVEADLQFAASTLAAGGYSSRANKGNAYAALCKFYLSNKEWQKAADAANTVLGLGYTLYPDYTKLFSIEGENNNEFILRTECKVGSNQVNIYMPHAFPQRYRVLPNWTNYGAQFRTYTAFVETFELQDERRKLFLTEYIPNNTTEVQYMLRDPVTGVALDNARSFKYVPDPAAVNTQHGNDIPLIRLADIMLTRAEALNELNGPTQEAIDLINQVRNRAKATPIALGDYPNKESLRDFLLAERGRELYTEQARRDDLIRHGKFVSNAIERGWPAKDYMNLYPIPQAQMDNNPNLVQNPGYN